MPQIVSRCQNSIPALSFKSSKRLLELSTHALSVWLIVQRPRCEKKSFFEPKSMIFSQKWPFLGLEGVFCACTEFWG